MGPGPGSFPDLSKGLYIMYLYNFIYVYIIYIYISDVVLKLNAYHG